MGFTEEPFRRNVCLQHSNCMSCPLCIAITGKDCRDLNCDEIRLFSVVDYVVGHKDYPDIIKWYLAQKSKRGEEK